MGQRYWIGVVLLVGMAVPAHAQVTLEWKFKEGDTFYVEGISDTKQTIKVAGQAMPQDMEQTIVESFKVVKVDGSKVILERKIESVKMKSAGPGAEEGEKVAKKMEGCTFTITLTPKNREVNKVGGVEELQQKVVGDNPLLKMMMSSILSEDALRHGISDTFLAYLPPGPVKEGDKWKSKSKLSLGPVGSLVMEGEFTYKGKANEGGKKLDRIDGTWTIAYSPPKEDGGAMPFKITKGNIRAEKATGTYLFDAEAGRLVSRAFNMRMKGTMSISAGGQDLEMELEGDQVMKNKVSAQAPK